MLEFFNTPDIYGQGIQVPAEWNYIRAGIKRNLDTVKEYYYNKSFAVKSNHILARVLNNLGVSYFYSLERFTDIVDAKAFSIAMNFKMSSPIYRGNIFRDIFYGGDIDEVLVAVDDSFDSQYVYQNWKSVKAVNVIYHPKSDLDMQLPNGKYLGTESGTAIISINIAMLAVQYKAFLEYELSKLKIGESPRSITQFIHSYVLPNMLDSHIDLALFNRAYNKLNNISMGVSFKRHVFHIVDFTTQVDNAYSTIIKNLLNSERYYKTILRSFPAAVSTSMEDVMVLPNNAPTKQIIWTNVISRLMVIEFMATISPTNGNRLDRNTNQVFLRNFKLYENDRALDLILSSRSQITNKVMLNKVIEMIKA